MCCLVDLGVVAVVGAAIGWQTGVALGVVIGAVVASVLERTRSVIVCCWDQLCDMSPRAAWRLERLGFGAVYDYALGRPTGWRQGY